MFLFFYIYMIYMYFFYLLWDLVGTIMYCRYRRILRMKQCEDSKSETLIVSFPVQVSLSNRYFFWVSTKIFVEERERGDALNTPTVIWKKNHFAIIWAYAYGCLTKVFIRYMYDMYFFINSPKYLVCICWFLLPVYLFLPDLTPKSTLVLS